MSTTLSLRPSRTHRPVTLSSSERTALVTVGFITLAALVLRLSQIHQSLFGDELWTYQQIAHHSLSQTLAAIRPGPENAPPLFFILAWISSHVGDPSVWIRLPSLVLGVATIPVVYAIGREAVSPAAGVVGAAVLATSPFSVYYGIEARPYATMAFFVALSMLAVLRAVRTGSNRWWALFVLAADAAAYSHYTAVFVLGVEAAWALWKCRHALRQPVIATACAVLLYVPWLPHLGSRGLRIIGALHPLNPSNVASDLLALIPGYPLAPFRAIPTLAGLVVIGVCALAGLIALLRRRLFPAEIARRGRRRDRLGLIALFAAATPVGVLLYSLVATDIWNARDLYAAVPAMALLLGGLLVAADARIRPVAIALVLGTLIFASARAVSPTWARPPLRAVAGYLDRVARPDEPVLMYPSFLGLTGAVLTELQRPHRIISGIPKPGLRHRPAAACTSCATSDSTVTSTSR